MDVLFIERSESSQHPAQISVLLSQMLIESQFDCQTADLDEDPKPERAGNVAPSHPLLQPATAQSADSHQKNCRNSQGSQSFLFFVFEFSTFLISSSWR